MELSIFRPPFTRTFEAESFLGLGLDRTEFSLTSVIQPIDTRLDTRLGEQRYRGNPRFPNAKFAYLPAPKFGGFPGLPNFQGVSFLPGLLAFPQALFTLAGPSYRGTGQRKV